MIETNQGFSSMALRLQAGVDETGEVDYKDKTYSRVLPTVTDDDFFAVGEALASLSAWTLHHVERIDRNDLFRTLA
ncbi:MAG TPA: DUF1659 domain-containing protein [Bacilli bacterium]|nr:DUF1659 domain-containing protein [Bacilli bacterium]